MTAAIICPHGVRGISNCKTCKKAKHKEWRDKNKGHVNQKGKEWIKNNPEKRREMVSGMRFHGRTVAGLWETQQGLCAICSSALNSESPVDHDHETGWVRGLLCDTCNSGMGMLRDSPDLLLRAIIFILNAREAEREYFSRGS